ncbi:hypothetical protein AB4Z50_35000 [Paenibacillus sp. 2TAB26]|uniref:hypothetical protein n=1 Tax=Paenibacillus sp. 2TAB26 TaxID=3233005 RepID=UPI003F9E816A
MTKEYEELIRIFDDLYDKGYRFLNSVENEVNVEEPFGSGKLVTPIMDRKLYIDAEIVTEDEKERGFNFIAFRKSVKLKDGKPIKFK